MAKFEPAIWKGTSKKDFKDWFFSELENCRGQRSALERKWEDHLTAWKAAIPTTEKEFPWPGASNIVFPLIDMHSTPVYADLMQTLHAPEDYWTPTARKPAGVDVVTPLREFLSAIDRTFLNMRQVNGRAFIDNNILGTAIYKTHFRFDKRLVRDYNEQGVIERRVVQKYQPVIDHIPLQHFYIPPDAWNIDPDAPVGGARWVAQKFYLTKEQFLAKAKSEGPILPDFDPKEVERVKMHEIDQQDPIDAKIRKNDNYEPFQNKRIELYEIWVRFDADGDGSEEDLVIIWHQGTSAILRATYSPYLHGKRPFHKTVYLPGPGFYGMGLAEQDEWSQLVLSKLLNATVDNVVLANTRMYWAPQGSNVQPGEVVHPGKVWLLPPGESMGEVRLGEVYPSIFNLISMFMQYGEMRSGVNELRQGNVSGLPSRTPATTILSILREGNKRFDMILSGIREVHGEMGLQVLQLIAQDYKENGSFWTAFCIESLGEEDCLRLLPIFDGPIRRLEAEWGVSVTATSGMVNKEVEKQAFVGLVQLMTQIYGQLIQTAMLMQQLSPDSIAYQTAEASYASGVEMMKRLLERFDVQNPSDYAPNLAALVSTMQAQQQGVNPAMTSMMAEPQPQGQGFNPALGGGGSAPLGMEQFGSLFGL